MQSTKASLQAGMVCAHPAVLDVGQTCQPSGVSFQVVVTEKKIGKEAVIQYTKKLGCQVCLQQSWMCADHPR